MTIKAVTFDFWATLYKPRPIDYEQRLLELKQAVEQYSGQAFDPERFRTVVSLARDTWSRTWTDEYRTITAGEWLQILLAELGVSLTSDQLAEIRTRLENNVLENPPTLVPEVKTVLADLVKPYKLAIISDTGMSPGRVLRQILEKDGIRGYFSQLTFSDEVGYSKPHSRAFLTTLNALGVSPDEAVHVGDLLRTDIAGAQNAGLRAVQYIGVNLDEGEEFADSPSGVIMPEGVIENHTELIPLLQQWDHET